MSDLVELMPEGIVPQDPNFHRYNFNGPGLHYPSLEVDTLVDENPSHTLARILMPKCSFGLASILMTGPYPSTLLSINTGARHIVGEETWQDFLSRRRSADKSLHLTTIPDFGITLNNQMVLPNCPGLYSEPLFTNTNSKLIVKRTHGRGSDLVVGQGKAYYLNREGSMPAGNLLAAGITCGLLNSEVEKSGVQPDVYNKFVGVTISSLSLMRSALLFQLSKLSSDGENEFKLSDTRDLIDEADDTLEYDNSHLSTSKKNLFRTGMLEVYPVKKGVYEINHNLGLLYEPFRKAIVTYNNLIGTQKGQDYLKSTFKHPFNHRDGWNIRHTLLTKTLKNEFAKPSELHEQNYYEEI